MPRRRKQLRTRFQSELLESKVLLSALVSSAETAQPEDASAAQLPAVKHLDPILGVDVHLFDRDGTIGAAMQITVGAAQAVHVESSELVFLQKYEPVPGQSFDVKLEGRNAHRHQDV